MSIWDSITLTITSPSVTISNGGIIGIITTHGRTSPIIIPHVTDGDGLIGTHGGDIHQSGVAATIIPATRHGTAATRILVTADARRIAPEQTVEVLSAARAALTVVTTKHIPTT